MRAEKDPIEVEGIYRVSPMQRGMLFHTLFAPGAGLYVEHLTCRLKGDLDAGALRRAFLKVIRRHPILRSAFLCEDFNEPVQVVHGEVELPWEEVDWTGLSTEEVNRRLDARLRADWTQGFDLTRAPLLRMTLSRIAPREHLLLWCYHHVLLDGWSLAQVLGELAALYKAEVRHLDASLPPCRPYRDFIEWLEKQDGAAAESFWRRELRDLQAPTALRIPAPSPDPARGPADRGQFEIQLPEEARSSLKTFTRRHRITFNTLLQGAWALVLSRFSGSNEVLFGATVSGRPADIPGIETMVGLFINTLPVRISISTDETILSWLEGIQDRQSESRQYDYAPLSEIQSWSEIPRGVPLFESLLVVENYPESAGMEGLGGGESIEIEPIVTPDRTNFPLSVSADLLADSRIHITYDPSRYDIEAVQRIAGLLESVLMAILADPSRRLGSLPTLPEPDRLLIESWSAAGRAFPARACLHRLFEEQADRTPDAIVLTLGGLGLTYAELNRRANRLAHHLRALGAGPESLVGLCVERSFAMVVGILGILKAGAAYVPLDTAYPEERLSLILDDARVRLLVTERSLAPRFEGDLALRIFLDDESSLAGRPESAPIVSASPGDTAYVIYTSGSTGRPKGTPVTHANVVRLFEATRDLFHFDPEDVWTLFHSVAFDFSVWEIWGALLHGGRLVIVPHAVSRSPESFHELIRREQVTVLNQTPSAFRQLLRVDDESGTSSESALSSLRLVIFGGEALEIQSLKPWFDRYGEDRPLLVNMYGITETTIHVTYRRIRIDDLRAGRGSVIGKPIPDLQVYILDAHGRAAPIGVPGEMYVGGAGVARGYLGRPALTAERFVPDPFSGNSGARLYRSGDLARRRPDGDVEYLGRIDHQVKVRGFRIELGEIESALDAHPAVGECVVETREEDDGGRRLVAWIAPRHARPPAVGELRSFLRGKLPEYMVPSAFVFLETLPLTAHGKIDRRALPEPGHNRPHLEAQYAPPRSPIEEALTAIWAGVLGVQKVGIDDNYFSLGGDSILSIQIRARTRKLGVDLPLQQLFIHPTIRELSRELGYAADGVGAEETTRPFSLLTESDRARLPEGVEDAYPLSELQAGMVFHSEYSTDYIVYVNGTHLRAPLDLPKLEESIRRCVVRHPMLRTSFDFATYSEPLQLVHERATLPLTVEDLRHVPPGEQETWIAEWTRVEMITKFDWERPPLFRCAVHVRSDDSFQFTFTEPFLDGWSVASVLTEIFESYFALLRGADPPLPPPLKCGYRDFVSLEQEAVKSEECRAYWSALLHDASPSRLPYRAAGGPDREAPPVPRLDVPLGPETTAGLRRIAETTGLPLKSLLLAAHLKVVSLLTGSPDVVTGFLLNGRPEIDGGDQVVGAFLNTLPFRIDTGNGSWIDLARRAFESEGRMFPWRRFPIQELERAHGASALIDTAFNFTHFHVYERLQGLGGAEVLGSYGSEQTYYALTAQFNVDEDSKALTLALDYRTLNLTAEQVEKIAGYYRRALETLAGHPEEPHVSRSLLSKDESRRLLVEINATTTSVEGEACLHRLFEARAAEDPGAVAVVFESERVTYRELNRRANGLAQKLRRAGVGPESLVGLCVDRSVGMVAALLGILKAGGAYVPLDPSYPKERLAFLLEDSEVSVLVSQERIVALLPDHRASVLRLEELRTLTAAEDDRNVANGLTGRHLAYVIYTSGSTGKPKGVMVAHAGVSNVIRTTIERLAIGRGSRILQAASLSFDASALEIFTALASGAEIHLVHREALLSGHELAEILRAQRITTIFVTPSLLATIPPGDFPDLGCIVVGGDACRIETAGVWSKGRRFFNAYAPTEASIYATLFEAGVGAIESLPVGRPIANMRLYLLDPHLQPVPEGVVGEIVIGGLGLARGYLNRPELSAERFIPDPFSDEPGARLYRTGDLARFRESGDVEFQGRRDHQVKIRGMRIELGEIESVLAEHPAVREAVVTAREDVPGDRRLVAYVTSGEGAPASSIDLRALLRERLPEPMVPSSFVFLEAMPLTVHGKIDSRALPAPDADRGERGSSFVAPRTPTEMILADMWARLLGRERVGVLESFFDLGGHSLLATQLVSRIRSAFQIDLSVRRLFESPTIGALAAHLDGALGRRDLVEAPPIAAVPREGDLPLSLSQSRVWFLEQLAPGGAVYNIASAFRIRGRLDADALAWSLGELIRRHESLRTSFTAASGRPVQVIHPPGGWELSLTDLSAVPAADRLGEATRLAREEGMRPFDLEKGPLVRGRLVRMAAEDHAILLTIHHLVTDGWSMGILVREMAALYEASAEGRPSPLPILPIQYADFAVWQRRSLEGSVLEEQRAYWRRQLAGAPDSLALPTDRPRPPVQSSRGAEMPIELPLELTVALKELSRREGATLFMTLLAALKTLLGRYARQEDISIGVPIASRSRPEIEVLVGFFVNTLVLRTDLSDDPTFRDLLARVKETSLGAFAHQDLPFDQVVEAVQPRRDVSHTPLFQVLFDLQNMPAQAVRLGDLELEPLEMESTTAQFDLSLTMYEGEGGLSGAFSYNTDLFDRATIDRLRGHLTTLLEAVVDSPSRRLHELPLMAESERHRLAITWNETGSGRREDICAHGIVEAAARRSPKAIAVACGEESLTYADLNRRSSRLARQLRRLGVGPEVRVGLCAGRSIEAIVGILGVLKAGGAYVPLDPSYPRDRLAFMIDDARLAVILTQSRLIGALPDRGTHLVLLDEGGESDDREAAQEIDGRATPDNLAYVIYTSGSTGRPKGVLVSHANLVHSTRAREIYYKDSLRSFLLLSSFAFDSSIAGLFWSLASGAMLVLPEEDRHQDFSYLVDLISRKRISHLLAVPSLYSVLLEEPKAARLAGARAVIVAGEACPPSLVRKHHETLPGVELFNEYGPTEGSVWSTVHACAPEPERSSTPIGRPIPDVRVYVLDPHRLPVPVGVPGEIHLAGAGVARGYLGHSDLTAEKFLPDPWSDRPGGRLYRTGDLARYLPDGTLEFLGRIDHQVKIRGFRIELGEIESALAAHPSVREAAVDAREEAPGDRRLAAYVVSREDPAPPAAALKDFLRQRLPESMIPAAFIFLDALPLTPNGKLDRRALPAPERAGSASASFRAPASPLEEVLAAIWSEILDLERVGADDDFFELGGHSLLATQVSARVREAFEIDLPLRLIFERPTVHGLAGALLESSAEPARIARSAELLLGLSRLSDEEVSSLIAREQDPAAGRPLPLSSR